MSGIDRRGLRQIANVAADFERIVENIKARNARRARSGRHVSGKDAHGGGLARAVGAEKTEDFAFLDGERNVINRVDVTVRLG